MFKFVYYTGFLRVSVCYFLLTLVNFALTSSPYSALHSGGVGLDASVTFTINIAYLLLGCIVFGWLTFKHFSFSKEGIVLCIPLFISLLINSRFGEYNSYIYDAVTFLTVSTLACYDAKLNSKKNKDIDFDYDFLRKMIVIFSIIGFVLVLLENGRFGYVGMDMARDNRGEVTLWVLLNIPLFLISFLLLDLHQKEKRVFLTIWIVFVCLVTVLSGSRTPLMVLFTCVVMYVYMILKNKEIIYLVVPILLLVIVTSDFFAETILLGNNTINQGNLNVILTGRYELWEFYWSVFCDNWLFGAGPNVLSEQMMNMLNATSEIGILKTVTSYGIIFGIIEIGIIVIGWKKMIIVLNTPSYYTNYTKLICFLFVTNILLLMQQHARIQSYPDFLCWYSMFYMFNLNVRKI